jgi:hypothetical protein
VDEAPDMVMHTYSQFLLVVRLWSALLLLVVLLVLLLLVSVLLMFCYCLCV